jgi:uncharacterized membrane protein YfhO
MENWFSEHGLPPMRFVEISTTFFMVMLTFLDRNLYEKHRWIHYLLFVALILFWVIALVFEPLQTKIFATLMVFSVVVVKTAINRERKNIA